MKFRVATVKATGKKYLVSYIDFQANKVVCWGEVTKRTGLKTWHGPNKAFLIDAVEISPEGPKTDELVRELVQQMLQGLRDEGKLAEVRHTRSGNIRYRVK